MSRSTRTYLLLGVLLTTSSTLAAYSGSLGLGIGGGVLSLVFFVGLFLGASQSGCDPDRVSVDQDAGQDIGLGGVPKVVGIKARSFRSVRKKVGVVACIGCSVLIFLSDATSRTLRCSVGSN